MDANHHRHSFSFSFLVLSVVENQEETLRFEVENKRWTAKLTGHGPCEERVMLLKLGGGALERPSRS
jgi:hypothetical protein